MRWRSLRRAFLIAGTVIGVLAVHLGVGFFPVCRDMAYVCEHTGSLRGQRVWFWGLETGRWYEESPIEMYMRAEYPAELVHRWECYSGQRRNILGHSIRPNRHGMPGPVYSFRNKWLRDYVATLPGERKKELYDIFSTGDHDTVETVVYELSEAAYAANHRGDQRMSGGGEAQE